MQLDLMGHDPKPASRWPGTLRDYGRHKDRVRYSRGENRENGRSVAIPMGRDWLTVKPSAKPTLVRTQHLPPPAETARELGIPGLAGLLCLVPLCFMMCRCEPLRSSDYGHMADGIGSEQAVHRTACSRISTAPGGEEPARRRLSTGGSRVWPTESSGSRENPADTGGIVWAGQAGGRPDLPGQQNQRPAANKPACHQAGTALTQMGSSDLR
jgi:hypothetical protein